MKILVIEDSKKTAEVLRQGLQKVGWMVEIHPTATAGLKAISTTEFDALVLDRMLPGMDGLKALKLLRSAGVKLPTIMLTARSSIEDRIEGLESGADDYLIKPFAISELVARIKVISKRTEVTYTADILSIGQLKLDRDQRAAFRGDDNLNLSPVEFKILEHLALCAGTVVNKKMLLEKVWGYHFDPSTSIVETHISRLRTKVDKPYDEPIIQTIRGVGYLIATDPE